MIYCDNTDCKYCTVWNGDKNTTCRHPIIDLRKLEERENKDELYCANFNPKESG